MIFVFLSLSHVVAWVRCCTWLYQFLIFASLLTFMKGNQTKITCLFCITLLIDIPKKVPKIVSEYETSEWEYYCSWFFSFVSHGCLSLPYMGAFHVFIVNPYVLALLILNRSFILSSVIVFLTNWDAVASVISYTTQSKVCMFQLKYHWKLGIIVLTLFYHS